MKAKLIDRFAMMAFEHCTANDVYETGDHGLIGTPPELNAKVIELRCEHAYRIAEEMMCARTRARMRAFLSEESRLDVGMFDGEAQPEEEDPNES